MSASQRMSDYRARKRAAGKCTYGGCHERTANGSAYCAAHRGYYNDLSVRARLARKSVVDLRAALERHREAVRTIGTELRRRGEP